MNTLTGAASPRKLLEVDLTTGELAERPIPPETSERFLGGLGLNAWLLYRHTGSGTDPLGPENVVLISPGLLTGTEAPTSPRVEVTTKSPLTGLIGTGNSGGHWGPRLKKAVDDNLTRYYRLRGWDPETGIPTKKTLKRLGLGEIADDVPAQ
ncbi:MAG TPA: aldehyde ferredoxin oxidoreductase N-terminal domain-containing protein [Candidatus Krumholzibacteriaceae bacterium]|nr:aldehyde ferredoxin oxidoreductase N-terminal domain-containing protein [Candidatus Krumholzibacteriaceae bacterium]